MTVACGELDEDDIDEHDLRIMTIPPDELAQPPCAQGAVEAEADDFAHHWDATEGEVKLRWPTQFGAVPEMIIIDWMLMAASTLAEGTGLGWDNVHPRAVLRLTRRLLQRLVDILLAAELIAQ